MQAASVAGHATGRHRRRAGAITRPFQAAELKAAKRASSCPVTRQRLARQLSAAPWQTYCVPERYDVAEIDRDLRDCRQRGLDWLDRDTTNQHRIEAPALQQLADDYVNAAGLVAPGRIDKIKLLLKHGIEQFAGQGHTVEAALMRDLYFGASLDGPIGPPGDLLERARRRFGDTEDRFSQRRRRVRLSFAAFLISYVASIRPKPASGNSRGSLIDNPVGLLSFGYADDSERFVDTLAEATSATIIGITNERLKPMLEEAIRRKRLANGPNAFWESLRIVFLEKNLLSVVNDEREVIHDSEQAFRLRRHESFYAHKSIGALLRQTGSSRWALFKSRLIPALTGTLFEFDDRKIVRIMIRRTRAAPTGNLYIELEDHSDRFKAVFDEIVASSVSDFKVPVGDHVDDTFYSNEARLYSDVLKGDLGHDGWLPMVLIITVRRRSGRLEPVLQLRTMENSGREQNRLSHLSGHITQEDCGETDSRQRFVPMSFGLNSTIPKTAALRQIQEVIGIEPEGLTALRTGGYLYPDMESLYFFTFGLELPESAPIRRRSEMHTLSVQLLLTIRRVQVLRSAALLCESQEGSAQGWARAAEVVEANLVLHDLAYLGQKLTGLARRGQQERSAAAIGFREAAADHGIPAWLSPSPDTPLVGLAGYQYREFFSVLLPAYRHLGVDQAAGFYDLVEHDADKNSARSKLEELYSDEHVIALLPIEL